MIGYVAVVIGAGLIYWFGIRTGRHMEHLERRVPAWPAANNKAVCEGCTHHYSFHSEHGSCAQYPCHCRKYVGPEPLMTLADSAIPNDLPGSGRRAAGNNLTALLVLRTR